MGRNGFKEFARDTLLLLYACLPKWNHAILWGWPVGEDSTLSLAFLLPATSLRRVIVLVEDLGAGEMVFSGMHPKIKLVAKNSLAAWGWFLTARYVFFTHRCFMRRFPRRVVSVNVWHGMIFKKLGGYVDTRECIRSHYALATSDFWHPMIATALGPSEILTTGLPRNDRLFLDRASAVTKLGLTSRPDVEKCIAWLPTYRKSVRGELREDGEESGSAFGLKNIAPAEINAFCASHNIMIWVKPHPMSAFEKAEEWSHLLIVDDDWLRRRGLSLYEALAASDALISDISSVVVDYLLVNRPIIHCFPDMIEYRNTRGFCVEPIENYLSGPLVSTWDEIKMALTQILDGDDPYFEQRHSICRLFHKYQDNTSTERLLRAIGL